MPGATVIVDSSEFDRATAIELAKIVDITQQYRIYYIDGDDIYIGPLDVPRETVLAYKPGDKIAEGPVWPFKRRELFITSYRW